MKEASTHWSYSDTKDIYIGTRKVHGVNKLPKEYKLAFVPRNAKVSNVESLPADQVEISSSYSWLKVIVAIFQSSYASYTLYQSRGDQIKRYGYAAFSLTVAPYAVMSMVNLLGALLTPDYPTLYLVRSDVMDEAEKKYGAKFDGVVGKIVATTESDAGIGLEYPNAKEDLCKVTGSFEIQADEGDMQRTRLHLDTVSNKQGSEAVYSQLAVNQGETLDVCIGVASADISGRYLSVLVPACPRFQRTDDANAASFFEKEMIGPSYLLFLAVLVVNAVSIAIVGGLSHFRKGESTTAQRVWTMTWLVFGSVTGFNVAMVPSLDVPGEKEKGTSEEALSSRSTTMIGFIACFCAPAVGGFVVVGQMLYAYGNCIRFD
jgi:hypothetical protein